MIKASRKEYENNPEKYIIYCTKCKKPIIFKDYRHYCDRVNKINIRHHQPFCSKECSYEYHRLFTNKGICDFCGEEFIRQNVYGDKRQKHTFCSQKCSAKYFNSHKKFGYRKSKAEEYIVNQLKEDYPYLNIKENDVSTIGKELDIYLPDLNLAFEINGIVHYKPIYGEEKLNKIQNNDFLKKELCESKNILLIIINISDIKVFKEDLIINKYNCIKEIINNTMPR